MIRTRLPWATSLLLALVLFASACLAAPPITALAIAPDGKTIVVGSQAGIELRSWPALEPIATLATELTNIHDLRFSPDGKVLAAGGGSPAEAGGVEVYRWPERMLLWRKCIHDDVVYGIAWRDDSAEFATASADTKVGVHDAQDVKESRYLEGHSRAVLALTYLGNGAQLLSAGSDESLRLWDVERGESLRTLANHTRPVHDLAVRPGGPRDAPPMVVSVSADRTVRFWQPTIKRMVRFARLNSEPLAVVWDNDGESVFVACHDGHVRTVDPDTAAVIEDRPAIEGVAYSLAIAADGALAVGGEHGQLRRLDASR